jgi:predicted nucleic acid-binding protein
MVRYLIDTNVLLRGIARTSHRNAAAVEAIAAILARGDELYLAPQVLVEFSSVATRPIDANGFGWPVERVREEVDHLLGQFPLLPETPALFDQWLGLVHKHGIIGKRAHDARLAAFLIIHKLSKLLTFNTGDFSSYGIAVVSPDEVASTSA